MITITPSKAAELADEIYSVQQITEFNRFLSNSIFNKTKNGHDSPHKHLKAEVGGRLLNNHKDGFGVCAEGGRK